MTSSNTRENLSDDSNSTTQKLLWKNIAQTEIKDSSIENLYIQQAEGFKTAPVYFSEDLYSLKTEPHSQIPGIFPYLRGPKATMYTHKPWTIRQYSGFSTAKESNDFYKKALEAGAQGISVAFDLPTHRGFDADHPRAQGDVGKAGVSINSIEDMMELFDGIDLKKVSVSMTMNGAVAPILAAFIVAGEKQNVLPQQLSGTIQNDILKEFMVRNTYIYPPDESLHIVGDIIEYCTHKMPKFNSISISGYHIQEAGADQALELAYTLANGLEYIQLALSKGLCIDDFAPRLSFFFGIGMNFYMEIAKLRAARFMWANLVSQFQPKDPRSSILRTHCQTSGWSLTEQFPMNNIIRTTIEAMSAIFGGTQSLHTNSFDEAVALPTEFSASLARNTQLILQEETQISSVVDPWGGSYFMEKLTHDLIESAQKHLDDIQAQGGMKESIKKGFAKLRIEEAATKKQAQIDQGHKIIIGLNKYQDALKKVDGGFQPQFLEVDGQQVLEQQIQKLKKLKSQRQSTMVNQALEKITNWAHNIKNGKQIATWKEHQGENNLISLCVEAIRHGATIGEISLAMEKVWSRYQAPQIISQGIYSMHYADDPEWKQLQIQISDFEKHYGRRPRMLVAKIGQDGHDRGAKIIASSFSDLGFDIDLSPLFTTPEEVVSIALENDVHIIGISSQAAGHKILIPELVSQLKSQGADDILVIIGGVIPPQDYSFLYQAGVSGIYGPGTPIIQAAQEILKLLMKK